jgi:hypothetical protein
MILKARLSWFAAAVLFVLAFALSPAAARADTLVVAGGGGTYKPGLAKSWRVDGNTVTFELAEGADGNQIAAILKERLAQATITLEGSKVLPVKLKVVGIPAPALLDQLSTLTIGEGDPLTALAALGGSVREGEGPEAGGSIRASKPMPVAALLGTIGDADRAERFEAEVVDVTRGPFPQVTLTLRVRRAPTAGSLGAKLGAGKIVEIPVMFAGTGAVDFAQLATQRNLAAFYAKKGDRLIAHAVAGDNGHMALDWVERK